MGLDWKMGAGKWGTQKWRPRLYRSSGRRSRVGAGKEQELLGLDHTANFLRKLKQYSVLCS